MLATALLYMAFIILKYVFSSPFVSYFLLKEDDESWKKPYFY